MEDFFQRNLEALKTINPSLHNDLQQIDTNVEFEVFMSEGHANILDIKNEVWVSNNASEDFKSREEEIVKFREYPFMYFFGLGNGYLVNKLLENEKHKQIVVVEPNLEMIYIALNLIDVKDDLSSMRLEIIREEELSFQRVINIFAYLNAKFYTRVFKLHVPSSYYLEKQVESYKHVMDSFLGTIEHIIKAIGNDISDSLLGVTHHIKNMPILTNSPKFSELLESKNSKLAVIVSTGPSLYQQLDLLKEAAEYITIISVDASFPILSKHGIKPDVVVSMERDEATSKFFLETTKEDHKGVVFLCASLQHQSVFNAIKDGQTVLSMRPFEYNYYFEFHDYGYICAGMSAANMAHELAGQMGFETCTFIGQDLAYGKDGSSHSKGHVFGSDQIKDGIDSGDNDAHYESITLPAYGGKGRVESMMFWEIFLRFIEQNIEKTQGTMLTINSTEGGVRIKGSLEIPFKEVLGKYRIDSKKEAIRLLALTSEESALNLEKAKAKIETILKEGKELQERIQKTFLIIAQECKVLENIEKEEALKVLDMAKTIFLLDEISAIRKYIEKNDVFKKFMVNLSQSILSHEEFKLAKIRVMYVDNPEDNQLKALQWILEHRYWLFSLSGIIDNTLRIVDEESRSYMH